MILNTNNQVCGLARPGKDAMQSTQILFKFQILKDTRKTQWSIPKEFIGRVKEWDYVQSEDDKSGIMSYV
jgi:hypothetical protein